MEYEIDQLSNVKIHHGPQVRYYDNGINFKNKYPNAYIRDNKWISISERKYVSVKDMIENIVKKENSVMINMASDVTKFEPIRLDKLVEGHKVETIHRITIDRASANPLHKK